MTRITLVQRVEMSLQILGYYQGQIDDIMGSKARRAIERYRWQKQLNAGNAIDAELRNSLGIAVS